MLNHFEINRTLPFNYNLGKKNLELNEFYEQVFFDLPIKKIRKCEEKKKCFITVFNNLKYSEKSRSYIPIPRKQSFYSQIPKRYRKEFQTYDIMTSVVDGLENLGLLESVPGFMDFSKKQGKLTKIKPTNKFKELSKELEIRHIIQEEPRELIILKNRFDNTLLDYKNTFRTNKNRSQIIKYNETRQSCKISLNKLTSEEINSNMDFLLLNSANPIVPQKEIELKNPYMYRVFNGSFNNGGRFYNGIESNMPKILRKKILIDGEETVELDYNSFHIRILYHQIGMEFQGDAYSCLSDEDEQLRLVYKLVALCSINASNKKQALKAIRNQIIKNGLESTIININDNEILKLIENWESFHSRIKKFFYSDSGIKLQNLDSKIAAGIINKFITSGEVVLCIHDSFIVKKYLMNKLFETMKNEYEKQLKFSPVIS